MADSTRIHQLVSEVLSVGTPATRLNQIVVEVLEALVTTTTTTTSSSTTTTTTTLPFAQLVFVVS